MSRSLPALLAALLLLAVPAAFAQKASAPAPAPAKGLLSAVGTGTGASAAEALEAAKLAALRSLVKDVLKRDEVYRDLFVAEVGRSDPYSNAETSSDGKNKWRAKVTASVEEGIAEALYLGRYSTTLVSLLDQAEKAVPGIDSLISDGGAGERAGDLNAAETAYRMAQSKAAEASRLLAGVNDSYYFSTAGNRKTPELKALLESSRRSAEDGLGRVRAARDALSQDAELKRALALQDQDEEAAKKTEALLDQLNSIIVSPRSYETALLSDARDRLAGESKGLSERRNLLKSRDAALPADMAYARSRSTLLAERLDSCIVRIDHSLDGLDKELYHRSGLGKATDYAFFHEPSDYFTLGVLIPFCARLGENKADSGSLPLVLDAKAEGSFRIDSGGFWVRANAQYGKERFEGAGDSEYLSQRLDFGFWSGSLWGVGFKWDWLRGGLASEGRPLRAVDFVVGLPGKELGAGRAMPVWVNTFSWELPPDGSLSYPRDANAGLETVIRPNRWIRLEAAGATRIRTLLDGDDVSLTDLRAGFGFRLPFLAPVMWRLAWEARLLSDADGGGVSWSSGRSATALRFGAEYSF